MNKENNTGKRGNRYKHGLGGKEKLYSVWSNMRNRCNNPACKDYRYYGAKGVRVCDEWDDYLAFRRWAYANGYEPDKGLSIDRINNELDYCPGNCRFATKVEQMNNMTSNRILTSNGYSHNISQWSEITGIPYKVLEARVGYGWSDDEVINTPINAHRKSVEYAGRLWTLRELSEKYNISYRILYGRIFTSGWPIDKALHTNVRGGGNHQ